MSTTPAMAPGGGDVRARLQMALRAAMKARDTVAVSALRSALAAIANAEAIPVPTAPASLPPTAPATDVHQYVAGSTAGLAAAEAERREVTEEDAAGIVQAEVTERQVAARQYQAAGHADRAGRLLREAQVIQYALENTPGA
jgi:uncharacterized protein